MRGAPAWHRRHSVTHPSTVSALRADPPSPTREKEEGVVCLAKRNRAAILAAKIILHTGKLVSRTARLR
ncbi:hypothetical protein CK226_05260 [Mesorhizobium sp. WSM4311]|nr:hypothetical protein CK226_05260 [Mesorhizobium sp. WSM4311]TRD05735.1 hypothetical protein FJV82_11205 [Mesorhizobium sp. WSM4305]